MQAAWSEWSSLGGSLSGPPTALTDAEGTVHVFARGDDRSLMHLRQTAELPYVFAREEGAGAGAGAGVEQREWLHRGVGFELRWAKWHSLGGVLASGPVAAVTLNQFGSLEVYPNLTLTLSDEAPSPNPRPRPRPRPRPPRASQPPPSASAQPLPLALTLARPPHPGPPSPHPSRRARAAQVYVRFADKAIWRLGQEASFEGGAPGQPGGVAWGQWHAVGGIAAGPPALGRSMHDGTSIVFVRQADKQLYHKSQRPGHNGTRFEPDFELMRGAFAAGPALVQKASGLLEVLMQGVDRQVYHSAQTERCAFLGFGSFNALGGRTRQFAC